MPPSRRFALFIGFALALPFASPAFATCRYYQDVFYQCTSYSDGTTSCRINQIYYYEVCETTDGNPTGGSGSTGGPGGGLYNAFDENGNGTLDNWVDVVGTNEPCSANFRTNDRLGVDHGGVNTVRTGHTGVDIQANDGDPIYSMKRGSVSFVGYDANLSRCGYSIQISHMDGSRAVYCHMEDGSSPFSAGAPVRVGAQIGRVGRTGVTTGAHLHLVFFSPAGNRQEYFNFTDAQPAEVNLNSGGC